MKIQTCNAKREVTSVESPIQWKPLEAVLSSSKANT